MTTPACFDPREFRRALGNFATGVTIMTATSASGEKVGMTANSFNSVSLDPALILWSIDKRSLSLSVFLAASHFAVNILAADQLDLSNRFARPGAEKFNGIEHAIGAGGAPLFNDCSARLQCERWQTIDGGDHWILIGRVVAFDDFGRAPLVYHQGAYSMVLPHARMLRRDDERPASSAFQGRLRHNLYYLMTQAVRSYQGSYQPHQLATGLRTSEARLLMVLENDSGLDMCALQREVAVPRREIEEAVEILKRKDMVVDHGEGYALTPLGEEQTEALWSIAQRQQERVFEGFSEADLATFRRVLKAVIAVG
ncbi:MAG: p-hydroxyphenylacetate 3-hydroxylase, reductase component [Pseudomonas citronellolis]|nr:MAG: p-hydroxyphenylacetate 3-hydroxylase, reductase component [Pseudomonas citronellolis]